MFGMLEYEPGKTANSEPSKLRKLWYSLPLPLRMFLLVMRLSAVIYVAWVLILAALGMIEYQPKPEPRARLVWGE